MNEFFDRIILKLGTFTLTMGKVSGVFAILVVTVVFLNILSRALLSSTRLSLNEKARRNSLIQLIKYVVWVIAISICLTVLGFNVTLMLAGSAALLVGLGLGLQNIFSDLVSGLFMLMERAVKVGDIMEVE